MVDMAWSPSWPGRPTIATPNPIAAMPKQPSPAKNSNVPVRLAEWERLNVVSVDERFAPDIAILRRGRCLL